MSSASYRWKYNSMCVGYFRCLLQSDFCSSDTIHFIDKIDLCHGTLWHCLVKLSSRMNNSSSWCVLEYLRTYFNKGSNTKPVSYPTYFSILCIGFFGGCFGYVCFGMIFVWFCLSFFVCLCLFVSVVWIFSLHNTTELAQCALLLLQYICTKSDPVMEGRAYC